MRLAGLHVPVIKVMTVAMIATLLGLMIVEVVMRYVFLSSLIWAEEACRYLLIWCSFLAAVLAYERGELANVELFRQRLPQRAQLVVKILANGLCIAFLAVLVWYGTIFASRVGGQPIPAMRFLLGDLFGPDFPVPRIFWVYISLPVGMALLAIRMAVDLAGFVRLLLNDQTPESGGGAQGA